MKRYLCLLLTLALVLLAGCSLYENRASGDVAQKGVQPAATQNRTVDNLENKPADENTRKTDATQKMSLVLYYQDGQGYVIPVTRKVGKQEGIAKTALQGLVDNPFNREEIEYYGLYPVLPMGTEIRGVSIKEGTAIVDFTGTVLQYKDKTAERNIVTSVIYTLTEFKTIKNVKIRINGQEQKALKFGTDISGSLNRENILINSAKANLAQQKQKCDVFLLKTINEKFDYVLPVSVEMSGFKAEELPGKITEAFSRDWSKDNLYSSIPQGTKLLKADLAGNILSLDFSSELKSYGGGHAREDALIRQILYSSKQIKGVEKVKILVNGKENDLPEGTEMTGGLAIPAEINNYIDEQNK